MESWYLYIASRMPTLSNSHDHQATPGTLIKHNKTNEVAKLTDTSQVPVNYAFSLLFIVYLFILFLTLWSDHTVEREGYKVLNITTPNEFNLKTQW